MLQRVAGQLAAHYGVELVEGDDHDLRGQLAGGKIQLALTLLDKSENGPEVTPLLEEPYVVVMAAHHPLAGTAEVAAGDLAREIMIARRACEALQRTSRFFTDAGVRPRFALRSENEDRCLRMVAAGLGITVAPRSLAPEGTATAEVRDFGLTRRLGFIRAPVHPGSADEAEKLAAILERIAASFSPN